MGGQVEGREQSPSGSARVPSRTAAAHASGRLEWVPPRSARVVRRLLLVLALLGPLLLVFGVPGFQSWIPYRIDLDVYQLGGSMLRDGQYLYGELPATQAGIRLPFTYPPVAALLFVPLALLPHWAANLLLSSATIVSIWLVQHLVVREETGLRGPGARCRRLPPS